MRIILWTGAAIRRGIMRLVFLYLAMKDSLTLQVDIAVSHLLSADLCRPESDEQLGHKPLLNRKGGCTQGKTAMRDTEGRQEREQFLWTESKDLLVVLEDALSLIQEATSVLSDWWEV